MIQPPVRRGFVQPSFDIPAIPAVGVPAVGVPAVGVPAVEVPAVDPGLTSRPDEHRYPIEFRATAGEYFRIWIVNLLLTVLTLGIYGAWAKVRKRRYFCASTRIDGEGFDYRGRPLPILKGRLLALGLVGLLYGAAQISPLAILPMIVLAVFLFPWLIVRSLAFTARNTAYRNVTFRFSGRYWPCLKIVLVYLFWVIVTLGIMLLAYPYFKRKLVHFAAENHAFGTTPFTVADFKKPFIGAYSGAIGWGFLFGIPAGFIASALKAAPLLASLPSYVLYLGLNAYVRARSLNAVWNNLSIGAVKFESSLEAWPMVGIYLTNVLAIIATLGLATPWAVVRTMRYRASRTTVVLTGPATDFVESNSPEVSAMGQEVGEVLDIDVAL